MVVGSLDVQLGAGNELALGQTGMGDGGLKPGFGGRHRVGDTAENN